MTDNSELAYYMHYHKLAKYCNSISLDLQRIRDQIATCQRQMSDIIKERDQIRQQLANVQPNRSVSGEIFEIKPLLCCLSIKFGKLWEFVIARILIELR